MLFPTVYSVHHECCMELTWLLNVKQKKNSQKWNLHGVPNGSTDLFVGKKFIVNNLIYYKD